MECLPLFPWLVFLGAIFVGAIEVRSIMEPANEKESKELKQVAALAAGIAKYRQDPAEIIQDLTNYLSNKEKQQ